MGFFDRKVRGSFDRMFDYNRDGVLDMGEQAFQMDYIGKEMEEKHSSNYCSGLSVIEMQEISEKTGLQFFELEDMDEDEIEQALEEADEDEDDWDDEDSYEDDDYDSDDYDSDHDSFDDDYSDW